MSDKIKSIKNMGDGALQKEKGLLTILEIAQEIYKRGFKFNHHNLYESDPVKFLVNGNDLLPPLNSLQGLGETAAKSIVEARKDGSLISIENLRNRTKISKTVIEIIRNHGCLDGMPENSQLTLF